MFLLLLGEDQRQSLRVDNFPGDIPLTRRQNVDGECCWLGIEREMGSRRGEVERDTRFLSRQMTADQKKNDQKKHDVDHRRHVVGQLSIFVILRKPHWNPATRWR